MLFGMFFGKQHKRTILERALKKAHVQFTQYMRCPKGCSININDLQATITIKFKALWNTEEGEQYFIDAGVNTLSIDENSSNIINVKHLCVIFSMLIMNAAGLAVSPMKWIVNYDFYLFDSLPSFATPYFEKKLRQIQKRRITENMKKKIMDRFNELKSEKKINIYFIRVFTGTEWNSIASIYGLNPKDSALWREANYLFQNDFNTFLHLKNYDPTDLLNRFEKLLNEKYPKKSRQLYIRRIAGVDIAISNYDFLPLRVIKPCNVREHAKCTEEVINEYLHMHRDAPSCTLPNGDKVYLDAATLFQLMSRKSIACELCGYDFKLTVKIDGHRYCYDCMKGGMKRFLEMLSSPTAKMTLLNTMRMNSPFDPSTLPWFRIMTPDNEERNALYISKELEKVMDRRHPIAWGMHYFQNHIERLFKKLQMTMVEVQAHSARVLTEMDPLPEGIKCCPTCRVQIFKTMGCDAITCEICKTLFCFVCGQVIRDKCGCPNAITRAFQERPQREAIQAELELYSQLN